MKTLKLFSTAILLFTLLQTSTDAFSQRLATVKSFGYQLQDLNVAELAASSFDLLVIDYSLDGSEQNALKQSEVQQIISGKINRKVISYFSIGEAEDYRYYFKKSWVRANARKACKVAFTKKAPSWLDQPNRSFCGNYKTRFWERGWQKILFGQKSGAAKGYLDRIIDAGFQGVYLDIIDGYEYWLDKKRGTQLRKSAAKDMALLVERISKYAREQRGKKDFIVIPQNGAGILDELSESWKERYLQAIDGIGAEDTFYFGDLDEDNPLDIQTSTIENLKAFIQAGKIVVAIDYLRDATKIADFQRRACAAGFIPQVGLRTLDLISFESLNGCG
jgi:cysteinyl-tRNA synthetase